MTDNNMPLRARLASTVSKTAAACLRAAGRGDGSVIGGWIGLKIDPELLSHLAAGRQVALISGTNGKTTTTRLTAAAMGVLGRSPPTRSAPTCRPDTRRLWPGPAARPYAVLEVDEHYLDQVLAATAPVAVALLNLSRDQLDRAKEVAMMARLLARRTARAGHACGGQRRRPDGRLRAPGSRPTSPGSPPASAGTTTPGCAPSAAYHIERDGDNWFCTDCDLRRPTPQWTVDGNDVIGPVR